MSEAKDTRWKPGQSGNPAGKPKGAAAWKKILEAKAAERFPKGCSPRTWADAVWEQMLKAATGRPSRMQVQAGIYILDQLAGKAVQTNVVAEMTPEQKKQAIENLMAILKEDKQEEKADGSVTLQ